MAAEDDFFVTFKDVCFYTGIGIGSLFALIFLIWLCNNSLAAGILRWCEGLCECYRDCNCDNCCYVCCCCCLLEQLDKLCEDADCKSDCESSYNLCKQDYAKLNWKFFFKPSCCFCRQKNDWDGDDYNGRSFDGSRNIDLHSVTTLPYDYNNSRVSNQRVANCNHIVTRQPTFELQHIQPTSPVSPTVYSNHYTTSQGTRQTYVSPANKTLNKPTSPVSPTVYSNNYTTSQATRQTYVSPTNSNLNKIKNHPGNELNIEANSYHIKKQDVIRKPRSSSGTRSRSVVRNAGIQENQNVDSYKIENTRRSRSLSAGRRRSRSRNRNESDDRTLDLHELSVKEAMSEVRVFLGEKLKEYKENNRSEEYRHVDVITGRGLHSKDNIPKIKPAVEEYLDKHKYQYIWKAKGGKVDIDLASYVTTQEENYDYDD